MDLTQRHAAYLATQSARTKSRDLYSGSEAVRAKGETYLFKEKNEVQEDFDLRLKRAVIDPYVEKIVGARQSLLFAKAHTRELPEPLELFRDDVDMKGASASTFFHDIAQEAQTDGIAWVAVDMPRLPDGGYASAQAERNANHRVFFEQIPGSAVIDWEVGPDRQLVWAVIEQSVANPRASAGDAIETKTQWKVWSRAEWAVYELAASEDGGKVEEKSFVAVETGTNPTGVVPLVPFLGVPYVEDFAGWPAAASVLDHIILIYNKNSDLDWFERLTSHPIPYAVSPKKPEKLDVNKGFWIESGPNSGSITVGYLETTGAAFGSIRDSIQDLEAKILRIALAQARKDSAQVQSAEGQREDRKIFASSLKSASVHYEDSEQRCWEIAARWIGVQTEIEIEYTRDFDDRLIEATMIQALSSLADANRLSTKTLLNILQQGEVLPEFVDIDEEVEQMQAQEAEVSAATLAQLRAVA